MRLAHTRNGSHHKHKAEIGAFARQTGGSSSCADTNLSALKDFQSLTCQKSNQRLRMFHEG